MYILRGVRNIFQDSGLHLYELRQLYLWVEVQMNCEVFLNKYSFLTCLQQLEGLWGKELQVWQKVGDPNKANQASFISGALASKFVGLSPNEL